MNQENLTFGPALARYRQALRLSQEGLGMRCGLSQRHISFLETGRAQPGRQALRKLVAGLGLRGSEAATLLAAAGLRAAPHPLRWNDGVMAPIRDSLARLVDKYEPWPSYVFAADGAVLLRNGGVDRLLDWLSPDRCLWSDTAANGAPNIFDLSLHPDGVSQWLVEPERTVPHILRRLRNAARHDAGARRTFERVSRYPAARADRITEDGGAEDPAAVVAECYRAQDRTFRFHATLAHFGAAEDRTAENITIETLIPADAETAAALESLSPVPAA